MAADKEPDSVPSLLEKLQKSGVSVGECLEWSKARSKSGYGQTYFNGKVVYVHRLVWEILNGPIPEGGCILHTCDNPPCFFPDHLWLGTMQDNARDMANKGRQVFQKDATKASRGERHGLSKMTPEKVIEMRRLHGEGWSQRKLAKKYNLSQASVWAIVNRETWKHV